MVCETPLPFEDVAGKSLRNTSTIYICILIDSMGGGMYMVLYIPICTHVLRLCGLPLDAL